jgi:phosphoglycerate dehydrogenase-like enzyme
VLLVSKAYLDNFSTDLNLLASNLASQGGSLEWVILHPLSSPSEVGMEDMTPSVDTHGISSYDLNRINCAFASEDLQFNFSDMRRLFGVVMRAPKFRWLAISWIGIDFALFDSVKQNNHCWITNAAGTNALPIAMSVLAAILAFNRGLVHWVQATTKQVWPNRQLFPRRKDLVGQTLLIFGFGAIGKQLGMLAKGIGMKVVGVKRSRPAGGIDLECCDELIHPNQLSIAVQQADVVVITAPLSSSTRNLFNAKMLNLLQDGVIFCNVGRGGIVDENTLAHLLQIGKISYAYLDVFSIEPLPLEHPLWKAPNLIISPHDSASCSDNAQRVQNGFLDNLSRFGRKEVLENVQWIPAEASKL